MSTEVNLNTADVTTLAAMLLNRTTDTAFGRLAEDARDQKQSLQEIAHRRASNILRSLSLRQAS